MKKVLRTILFTALLSACALTKTPEAKTVSYLQALADKNEALMLSHICPDYEFDALLELDALAQVETELTDLSCKQVDMDGNVAHVMCNGSIVASYGSELFNYDLSGRTYNVVQDGDDWLVCGYTK